MATPADQSAAEPRRHHYLFAHLRMPQLVLSDSTRFVAAAAEPGFLERAWAAVGADVAPEHRLAPGPLMARISGEPGSRIAVVRLPTPTVPAECYFVAAREGVAAMVTLEAARDAEDRAWTTVVGRWDAEGHTVVAYGEPADEARFTELAAELLTEPS